MISSAFGKIQRVKEQRESLLLQKITKLTEYFQTFSNVGDKEAVGETTAEAESHAVETTTPAG